MAKPKKPPKDGGVYINGKRVTQAQWESGEFLKAMLASSAAQQPAPKPAAAPAPAAPARVDPFFTPDDLLAISQFSTDLATQLESLDTDLAGLETDTTYQKTNIEKDAKVASSSATDDAIARGIFRSSVKDANLYDIEASRKLSEKFLDDKLTAARLHAGTQKKILGTAKEEFDKAMAARQAANATGVNDTNSSAWAEAMAAWEANPVNQAPAVGPAPAGPSFKPAAPQKGLSTPAVNVAKPAAKPRPANQSSTKTGSVKPRKPGKVYG